MSSSESSCAVKMVSLKEPNIHFSDKKNMVEQKSSDCTVTEFNHITCNAAVLNERMAFSKQRQNFPQCSTYSVITRGQGSPRGPLGGNTSV